MNRTWIKAGLTAVVLMAGVMQGSAQQEQPNLEELQKGFANMMQAMTSGATNATLIDFRELKALLPASLPDMKRTSAKGEKNSAMGMSVSQATGRYENEEGGSITIEIQDLGGTGMSGLLAMGFQADVESESDDGYEKTYTYKDNKVREEYNTSSRTGELSLLAGQRVVVKISASDVDAEVMTKALESIDVSKLSSLSQSAAK